MKKIGLIVLLAGVIVFGIAGCGNNAPDSHTEHKKDDGHLVDDTAHHDGDTDKHMH